MSVGAKDVHHLAALARLRVSDAEAASLRDDLARILAHVDRLQALVDVPALSDTPDDGAVDRGPHEGGEPAVPDAKPSLTVEPDPLLQEPPALAPRWEEGFFVVPPPRGVTPEGG